VSSELVSASKRILSKLSEIGMYYGWLQPGIIYILPGISDKAPGRYLKYDVHPNERMDLA
jgi:hypothetical protein